MDLKQEDILNVVIDADFLLSYKLDKLSLESIKKDIFEELQDEIASDDKPDISSYLLTESNKTVTDEDSDINPDSKLTSVNIKLENEELCESEIKAEVRKEKKDINGNEEIETVQNLNKQLTKLELSDSGNEEEYKEIKRVRERGLPKSSQQSSKPKKKSIYSRRKEYDKTQFSSEKLRFCCGSIQIKTENLPLAGPSNASNYSFFYSMSPLPTSTESSGYTFSNNESFDEGCMAYSLNSPESGYDTSSISGSSPPPQFSISIPNPSLDLSLEDQNVIDAVAELESTTTNYVSPSYNLSCIDKKDHIGKLVNYLKDDTDLQNDLDNTDSSCTNKISVSANNHADLNVSEDYFLPSTQVQPKIENGEKNYGYEISEDYGYDFLENSPNFQVELSSVQHIDKIPVPINNVDLNNISSVEFTPLSNNIQQRVHTQKKISIKPVGNKAKDALRKVLSEDKLLATERRIYKKAFEDKNNHRIVNIIYVVDENDGASENQTNLHMAVLNFKLEEIFSLVEIHKQYKKPFNDLNNRDKSGKTALDYALKKMNENKNMPLVVDYLLENMVCQGVKI